MQPFYIARSHALVIAASRAFAEIVHDAVVALPSGGTYKRQARDGEVAKVCVYG